MEIIAQGQPAFRTRLMDADRAARFSRCLTANPRFANVAAVESPRSAGRWFVQFQPASEERQAAILARQQTARQIRADREAFVFVLDIDGGRPFCWCHSLASGEVYEVDEESCSCPDHVYRCKPAGLACKHQLALAAAAVAGEVRPAFDLAQAA